MSHSEKLTLRSHSLTPPERAFISPVLLRAAIAALALIPVASFADTRAGGETTTGDVTLDAAADEITDVWDTLVTETLNLSTTSNIIVTACSDVDNPGGSVANQYKFEITLDTDVGGLNTGSMRTIDDLYDDPAKDDPDVVHVCSTRFLFAVTPGDHTIRWQAAKASLSMANTTVFDTSMVLGAFPGSQL